MGNVVVIGVDGATFDIIDPLIQQGKLPALSRLMEKGARGVLRSTIPPLSPVAWTSLSTGVQPDKHGIFDFSGRFSNSYDFHINTTADIKAVPMWMQMSHQGKRVMVIGATLTYPPHPVNGEMVSGLGAPPGRPMKDYTHPAKMGVELEQKFGHFAAVADMDMRSLTRSDQQKDLYLESFGKRVKNIVDVFEYLWKRQPHDFAMPCFLDTDGASHFFWKYMDSGHKAYAPGPYSNVIPRVYECVDAAIDKIMAIAGNDVDILVVSDHGFGPLNRVVFLNNWLASLGHIRFGRRSWLKWGMRMAARIFGRKRPGKRESQIVWSGTRAFSSGTVGNIYINLEGRDPQGLVPLTEYDAFCDQLSQQAMLLKDPETGQPVVERVHRASALYRESQPPATAPDLLIEFKKGYSAIGDEIGLHAIRDRGAIVCDANNWSGVHEPDGIFIGCGPSFRQGITIPAAQIIDVAPTVLHLMDLPVPQDMDGSVVEAALTDVLLTERPVHRGGAACVGSPPAEAQGPLNPADNEAMLKRLRDLGYLA